MHPVDEWLDAATGPGHSGDATTSGQSAQLWTCGMHPQVIENEPGICPICAGEAGAGAGELQIDGAYVGEICDGYDNDFDGVQQAWETGIPNVVMYIDIDGNWVRDPGEPSATTDTSGEERERLFEILCERSQSTAGYQAMCAPRELPLVVLREV